MIRSSCRRLGRFAVLLVGLLALLAGGAVGADARAGGAAGSAAIRATTAASLSPGVVCRGCPCPGCLGDHGAEAAACAVACLHVVLFAPAPLPAAETADVARPAPLALPSGRTLRPDGEPPRPATRA